MNIPGTLILLVTLLVFPHTASAQLRLSRLISDGVVVQRDVEIPVRGWASPGDDVTIEFLEESHSTVADGGAAWEVSLPAMAAGGPYEITVRSKDEVVQVRDVMVGDVWLASGQSNMEWVVDNSDGEPREDPMIRQFKIPRSWSYDEQDTLAGGEWSPASADYVADFTAVGYYFADALRERLDIPIGIINTSWGGSRIEPWMSLETLGTSRDEIDRIRLEHRAREDSIRERVRSRIGSLPDDDAGMVDGTAAWAMPDLDDSSWIDMPVPGLWEAAGFDGMDGVAWYRTRFELTEEEASRSATLGLGMIDDSDVTWVNGVEVGRTTDAWNVERVYKVPSELLRAGENVISVRVEDFGWGGGISGPPESVFLEVFETRRPLPDEWKFMVGQLVVNSGATMNQIPTLLWNQMIHPLIPFPVRGYIWYQGESNASRREDALAYAELFPKMITSWRDEWGRGDTPFVWAQLANFMAATDVPAPESNWALLRESQSAALDLPATAQAILIDIGDADDIHPRNKRDVGRRLALAALNIEYDQDVVYSGPTFRDYEVVDGGIRIAFGHVGGGLVARGDSLGGFAIAGPDRHFVWAEARIDGASVVVSSPDVRYPLAVRYAWADNPVAANLFNAEGLPAAPFRTDCW